MKIFRPPNFGSSVSRNESRPVKDRSRSESMLGGAGCAGLKSNMLGTCWCDAGRSAPVAATLERSSLRSGDGRSLAERATAGWFKPNMDGPLMGGTARLEPRASCCAAAGCSFTSTGVSGGSALTTRCDGGGGNAASGFSVGVPGPRLGSSAVPHIPQKRKVGALSSLQLGQITNCSPMAAYSLTLTRLAFALHIKMQASSRRSCAKPPNITHPPRQSTSKPPSRGCVPVLIG